MKCLLVAALLLCAQSAPSQDSTHSLADFPQGQKTSARTIVASCVMAGIIGSTCVWAFDSWWEGNAHRFNFYREGWFNDYALGIDKAGHAYASYFYFHTFHNVMLWADFDPSTALWWGAGITEFLAFCLEVGDGFSTYGFSYQDLMANTFGATFGVLQVEFPWLQNFSLKWSYIPVRKRDGLDFTQNYDAHTYWLSFNIHGLLPDDWKPLWPQFIQLALGYSVDAHQTRREGVIGLDFNFEVFPAPNRDILLVQKTLNMLHVPAPAIKFTEGREPQYFLFQLN